MALVRINSFGGRIPRLSARHLGQNMADIAKNCKLWSKTIRAWNEPAFVQTPSKPGTIRSIYLFDDQYWFHWTEEVEVERTQIAGTVEDEPVPFHRTYFTGQTGKRPQVTDTSIATAGGGADYPTNSYDLGIPAPESAPLVSAPSPTPDPVLDDNGDPVLDDNGNALYTDPVIETTQYVYTFVRIWNGVESEGQPSPASNQVDVKPGDPVTVSGMNTTMPITDPGVPAWQSNVTHKRIYRVATGIDTAEFQFVAQVELAVTQHNDSLLASELGYVMPSETWRPPPDDLHSLVDMPNGIKAGLSGNRVCFCEPYQPHAWPLDYQKSVTYNGVGLGVFGQSVIVATNGKPSVVTGVDPQFMAADNLDIRQACVSKESIVDMGEYVLYASPDGLTAVGTGIQKVLTEGFFYKSDWQEYAPESIRAYSYDGYYIGFYDTGSKQAGFIFDPRDPTIGFVDLDIYATAGYNHLETDTLYLVVDGDIVAWDDGATKMVYEWKSGEVIAPRPISPGICQIFAKGYPLTFKLYADGIEKFSGSVTSNAPFRLPSGYLATDYQAYFQGDVEIEDVFIGETMDDLKIA